MPRDQRHHETQSAETTCKHPAQRPIRSVTDLVESGYVDAKHAADLERVASRFSVAVTPAMLELIEPANAEGPIARQFIPNAAELIESGDEITDPIGDDTHSPLPGIVHRYHDRVLLTPIKVCPVYCRFCFRRESVGNPEEGSLTVSQMEAALDYIREHKEIWEVILSGGDPLVLSPRRLQFIIEQLNAIEHVRVIRIHTRVPVVDPERINANLIAVLKCTTPVFIVLHTNHADELAEMAKQACAKLIDNGIPMLSQSVLLKGVNDDAETLENLLRTLVENRIKPYYLHHGDKARGTSHFRTTIIEGQQLMRELRGNVSGLCQPEYILDIPGGAGKVPLSPAWIEPAGDGVYKVSDPDGCTHQYMDNVKL